MNRTYSGVKASPCQRLLAGRAIRFQKLDTAWTEIPETVMVQPGVPLSLTIMLQDSLEDQRHYRQLPIVFREENNRSAPGTSYLLSVTIRTDGTTSLSTSVVEWKKGNNGIGVID